MNHPWTQCFWNYKDKRWTEQDCWHKNCVNELEASEARIFVIVEITDSDISNLYSLGWSLSSPLKVELTSA